MGEITSNFAFLAQSASRLARFGALAERYFVDDAPAALVKLRQLVEFMAKDVAAQHGLLPKVDITFDETLRTLRTRNVLPREIGDIFYHLKRLGNAAAHEDATEPRALVDGAVGKPHRSRPWIPYPNRA